MAADRGVEIVEIRHFHLFCGLGGAARGFNRGRARVGNLRARFRCLGGVDVDAAAIRDFNRMAGVAGTVLDLFDREQYRDFHGTEPPEDWREATPEDVRRAAGGERPHIVFLSAPCKGFSGLLSEKKSLHARYQALNRLTLRGIWLMLEAWADDPPELIIFENVPRIATRGRALLDRIGALLRQYGYAVAETTHDCGEIGGLAQSRKRFLLVARHVAKVRPFLYEPPRRPLRAVGDILGRMPLPGDAAGGPMHAIPNLHWKTWVRLAFVEAGSDWRSLNRLRVVDGKLADYLIVPETWYRRTLGVLPWDAPAGAITGNARPVTGAYAVADPRYEYTRDATLGVCPWGKNVGAIAGKADPSNGRYAVADPRLGGCDHHTNICAVTGWDSHARTITGGGHVAGGALSVADPRLAGGDPRFNNIYRVIRWEQPSQAVTAGGGPSAGGLAVADPRAYDGFNGKGKYRIAPFDAPANTVIAQSTTGHGAFAVADPRLGMHRKMGDAYFSCGHYGVVPWDCPAYAVTGAAAHDNGSFNVADPRVPEANEKLVAIIRALDGTWHRPFTTLELAALQSLVDPGELFFDLDGESDSAKRERIGNAVPPGAAQAIADLMGETLLLAWSGETFQLSAQPVWVQPVAVALSVRTPEWS